MVLNEITKGMSNAAEQINENFKTSTIVDSGTTERGSYIKFGNGFCVQFIKFNHVRADQTVDYIIPLKDGGLSANITTMTGNFMDGHDVNNTVVYPYAGNFFRCTRGKDEWRGTSPFPVIVTIWAMYK